MYSTYYFVIIEKFLKSKNLKSNGRGQFNAGQLYWMHMPFRRIYISMNVNSTRFLIQLYHQSIRIIKKELTYIKIFQVIEFFNSNLFSKTYTTCFEKVAKVLTFTTCDYVRNPHGSSLHDLCNDFSLQTLFLIKNYTSCNHIKRCRPEFIRKCNIFKYKIFTAQFYILSGSIYLFNLFHKPKLVQNSEEIS